MPCPDRHCKGEELKGRQLKTRRTATGAKPGLRERNRLDKLARIKSAARDLFNELGFDRATTRAIAGRAHVGLGTLFNYADDKRDLVFLIFNEELDRITDSAFTAVDPRRPLAEQLAGAFGVFYREFAANPTLSRILLQELTFYSRGRLAGDFQRSKRRTIGFIEQLVASAQREGRIRADEDPSFIALSIFFLYSGAVRYWIAADRPDPKKGIDELQRMLEIHLRSGSTPPRGRTSGPRRR
jgi:AcrR family transcriptional regulator